MDAIDRHLIAAYALKNGVSIDEVEALLARVDAAGRPKRRGRQGWPRTWETAEIAPAEVR